VVRQQRASRCHQAQEVQDNGETIQQLNSRVLVSLTRAALNHVNHAPATENNPKRRSVLAWSYVIRITSRSLSAPRFSQNRCALIMSAWNLVSVAVNICGGIHRVMRRWCELCQPCIKRSGHKNTIAYPAFVPR
jgi:hypothetical protein